MPPYAFRSAVRVSPASWLHRPESVMTSAEVATLARAYLPASLRPAHVSIQMTGTGAPATVDVRDDTADAIRYAVLGVMLLPALLATMGVARGRRRWRGELRQRRALDAREMGLDVRALVLGRDVVRLSVSPHVESAAAVGRREICVSDALASLSAVERHAVIAHEMAHLARRDLTWAAPVMHARTCGR